MHPKDADRVTNSVDPDQTTAGAVWSESTLFQCPDLSVWILRIITIGMKKFIDILMLNIYDNDNWIRLNMLNNWAMLWENMF